MGLKNKLSTGLLREGSLDLSSKRLLKSNFFWATFLTFLRRRIIVKEMPDDWKGNGVTNFHLQWEDKDGDRLPIENRQDFMIANQEMIRTVLTPTIFVILSSLSGKY